MKDISTIKTINYDLATQPITFSKTDQETNGDLILYHKKNTRLIEPILFDPNMKKIDTTDLFKATDNMQCKLAFGGDLDAGNYTLILKFYYI
jgi:hypothetical protein